MSAFPVDQAARLRDLMSGHAAPAEQSGAREAGPRLRCARIIAIASGKGGVGKTNIAVNLSIALSRNGHCVVLVDADLGTANADVVLNVQPRFDLSHVIRGERTIDEIAVTLDCGPRLIRGASGLSAVADLGPDERQRLVEQLALLERRCDFIILDCGAGISQNVLAFAQAADELLVVTTPEPTAMTDAYALIKVLTRTPVRPAMSLVINQVGGIREAEMVAERVAGVAARFLGVCIDVAGHILRDEHVCQSVRLRRPVVVSHPRSAAATCLAALAERVGSQRGQTQGRPGFFRRLVGFFY